ncbi:Expansin B [Meloidogyne graminicola]|uniref:Expansin B n=1 Tax=Meloidogyne graminicola TaxID=189291 RepID=A0A8S9ZE53_9BILA|nr:Expansin B [Meloidogyne graminicola]
MVFQSKHSLIILFILFNYSTIVLNWVLNRTQPCDFIYYDFVGWGACGDLINTNTQDFASISYKDWVNGHPPPDPLCKNICIRIDNNKGKSITVPVKDRCNNCGEPRVKLSKNAFAKLADLSVGHYWFATKTFVKC